MQPPAGATDVFHGIRGPVIGTRDDQGQDGGSGNYRKRGVPEKRGHHSVIGSSIKEKKMTGKKALDNVRGGLCMWHGWAGHANPEQI